MMLMNSKKESPNWRFVVPSFSLISFVKIFKNSWVSVKLTELMILNSFMINGDIIITINDVKAVNNNKQRIADSDLFILNFAILILQIKLFNGLMLIEITIAMKKYIINS